MSIIVNIIENFLGSASSHYENKSQVQFDCPVCSEEKGEYNGDGKGNLAINYSIGVYKCWSCWERNNMYGSLYNLIKKYGNKQHLKDYLLVAPKLTKQRNEEKVESEIIVKLPESFKRFSDSSSYDTKYDEAYAYVKSRGLSDATLKRYNIGFTCDGKRRDRIVIPSYNIDGDLNYYIARSWYKWNKTKYLNPEADVDAKNKQDIIFNERIINWDSTIYLVEGAFDHVVTPNSIPLLGKFISNKLYHVLQMKCNGDVVIVLDGGPEEYKDTKNLYKKLNTVNLYNKVKYVYLKDGLDLSLINQKYGKQGIYETLRVATKYKESRL